MPESWGCGLYTSVYGIQWTVRFPGALQTFQNTLQSGEQENAKNLIQDLDIVWASKPVERAIWPLVHACFLEALFVSYWKVCQKDVAFSQVSKLKELSILQKLLFNVIYMLILFLYTCTSDENILKTKRLCIFSLWNKNSMNHFLATEFFHLVTEKNSRHLAPA